MKLDARHIARADAYADLRRAVIDMADTHDMTREEVVEVLARTLATEAEALRVARGQDGVTWKVAVGRE